MDHAARTLSRRWLLRNGLAFGTAAWATPGLFAESLTMTPSLTEGPFYPDRLPLDTDNDLLVINDSITPAVGEITHLSGRVTSAAGVPIRNAFVEIWQVDHHGVYLHSADSRIRDRRDSNFQGYGRFLTDSQGQYYFRTIKPVAYVGRTPHIHVAVSRHGHRVLTTQLFVKGHPQNERDGVLRGIGDDLARQTVLVDFQPIQESKMGELAAHFDIVLGVTAPEPEEDTVRGIGSADRERWFRGQR